MDFLDKLADKVTSGTKILSQKTDEVIEIAELKLELKNIDKQIQAIKVSIGDIIYEYFFSKKNDMPITDIQVKCRQIQQIERERNNIKRKLNALMGLEYCSYCGIAFEEDEHYCKNCGRKVIKS
ncbi:hypothetical protein [Inediibacterium massiliense]|uniref:hypothetical protein n=1 Tax=Inediibacterium massiliense TaxID=1658111 RepID=UPI0006B4D5BE|nr:hypothetical protein [Inediibacterium massiliense]